MRNRKRANDGFILADVLAALVIAAISLSTILTGVAHAARSVSVQADHILKLLEQENDRASKTKQIFVVGE